MRNMETLHFGEVEGKEHKATQTDKQKCHELETNPCCR